MKKSFEHLNDKEDGKVTNIGVEKRGKKKHNGIRLCFRHTMELNSILYAGACIPVVIAVVEVRSFPFAS